MYQPNPEIANIFCPNLFADSKITACRERTCPECNRRSRTAPRPNSEDPRLYSRGIFTCFSETPPKHTLLRQGYGGLPFSHSSTGSHPWLSAKAGKIVVGCRKSPYFALIKLNNLFASSASRVFKILYSLRAESLSPVPK